jgi:hypothetical protein
MTVALLVTPPARAADPPELTPPWDIGLLSPTPGNPLSFASPLALAGPDRGRAIDCLTSAVYYEAATEPREGQEAVAQVVLNRVRHPAFPKSVCGVVYQGAERTNLGCQFTFTCDGSLARAPVAWRWAEARDVAAAALDGAISPDIGAATHYHADYVSPSWRTSLVETRRIGRHIFYREAAASEAAPYAGVEPVVAAPPPPRKTTPHSRHAHQTPPPQPQDATFSIWGVEVAHITAGGKHVAAGAS